MNRYEITWVTQGSCVGGEDDETSTDEVQGEKAVIVKLLDIASNAGLEEALVDGDDDAALEKFRQIEKQKVSFQEAVDFLTEELSNLEVDVSVETCSPSGKESAGPLFQEQGDDNPLLCPFCQHEIVAADSSESAEAELGKCDHLILQHLWGHDADISDPKVKAWWGSVETKRQVLEEDCEAPETVYRQCPHIDHLIEYKMWVGPAAACSFGFRKA